MNQPKIESITPDMNIIRQNVEIELRNDNLPILKTKRLCIREIRAEDVTDEYVDWLNNPNINKYLEVRFVTQTKKSVIEYVESKLKQGDTSMHFGVYDQAGKRLVGTVSLGTIDHHHKAADISFVIGHPKTQGLGYASEAVHAVTHFSLTMGGIVKLFAGFYDGHIGSARVLAKNGYTVEGRIKQKYINHTGYRVDHLIVGILRDEYQQLRKHV
ncbi:MAG: GNAT family N-acetyltransferase [Pseudoalteromonas sp.]|uniref:GNAT family N-acetyltransferase n=1 Tax=Pseudoalteromonas sp. TaxID=53249 RepID=UPI0025FD39F4|nr:GNAT family N-acetyltransferase [Pseudoalteromonas sp.]MCH2089541.1 GNAT family N-acetyltransferase [Pseudoalteromonas sp.]